MTKRTPMGKQAHAIRLRKRLSRPTATAFGLLLLALGLMGCQQKSGGPAPASAATAGKPAWRPAGREGKMKWSLTSPAFADGERIPAQFTCDGNDISPELRWTEPPSGTTELALVCDDPDAPRGTWVHWVLYSLPADRRALPEAVPKTGTLEKLGGARQGKNSGGSIGYQGPCPPKGPAHHYHFRLYALDAPVALDPGAARAELDKVMKGHVLGEIELVGLYSR